MGNSSSRIKGCINLDLTYENKLNKAEIKHINKLKDIDILPYSGMTGSFELVSPITLNLTHLKEPVIIDVVDQTVSPAIDIVLTEQLEGTVKIICVIPKRGSFNSSFNSSFDI